MLFRTLSSSSKSFGAGAGGGAELEDDDAEIRGPLTKPSFSMCGGGDALAPKLLAVCDGFFNGGRSSAAGGGCGRRRGSGGLSSAAGAGFCGGLGAVYLACNGSAGVILSFFLLGVSSTSMSGRSRAGAVTDAGSAAGSGAVTRSAAMPRTISAFLPDLLSFSCFASCSSLAICESLLYPSSTIFCLFWSSSWCFDSSFRRALSSFKFDCTFSIFMAACCEGGGCCCIGVRLSRKEVARAFLNLLDFFSL